MLKKVFACASLAVAAAGAAGAVAPAAMASDTSGGNYSQNVNLIPHPCVDAKDLVDVIVVPIANDYSGMSCNEKSKFKDAHKGPLSDLIDAGAYQS